MSLSIPGGVFIRTNLVLFTHKSMKLEQKIEFLESKATAAHSGNPLILQRGLPAPVYECSLYLTPEGGFYVLRHLSTGKLTRANSTWSNWAKEYEQWLEATGVDVKTEIRFTRIEELWKHGVVKPPKHLWSEYGYSE